MKQCKRCHESKPLDQFHKLRSAADGLNYKCKDCWCQEVRKYRRENDSVREHGRAREREPERRAKVNEAVNLWKKNNPEKAAASRAVRSAIKKGEMERKPCEECGATRNIHGHHDDYSKPLDVRWLCALHHKRHHAAMERGST
tara:strand:- start:648 stop:1076 length:429 start_codon:yes stop_codon:yes gene_type:complete